MLEGMSPRADAAVAPGDAPSEGALESAPAR